MEWLHRAKALTSNSLQRSRAVGESRCLNRQHDMSEPDYRMGLPLEVCVRQAHRA